MPTITVNGRTYTVVEERVSSRTASARLRDGAIVIRIPRSCPPADRRKISQDLLRRMARKMERHPHLLRQWRPLRFAHGHSVEAMGKQFAIVVEQGTAAVSSGLRDGNTVRIRLGRGLDQEKAQEHTSILTRRLIAQAALPAVEQRVEELSRQHFGMDIGRVTLREQKSKWGSCSANGTITLNFRLLFAPPEILDYVIIHELAHRQEPNHSPAFWRLVGQAMPDYKEKKKWLRQNGHMTGVSIRPENEGL